MPKVAKAVPGIPAELAQALDDVQLKKRLLDIVKSLAAMVDADWHDSYEETGEVIREYVGSLEPHLSAVLECCASASVTPAALARCNLVMVEIADSWRAMSGVPFRCDPGDEISETRIDLSAMRALLSVSDDGSDDEDDEEGLEEYTLLTREEGIALAWTALARAAASSPALDDLQLQRTLKDATDYGVSSSTIADAPEEKEEGLWFTAEGAKRLGAALNPAGKAALAALPSRLGAIKQYRAIDRRFDGPKHRRTRDFDDYDF